jgi:hypothetical protein
MSRENECASENDRIRNRIDHNDYTDMLETRKGNVPLVEARVGAMLRVV